MRLSMQSDSELVEQLEAPSQHLYMPSTSCRQMQTDTIPVVQGMKRDAATSQRGFNIIRVSWFPTPEAMNAARKGNMGHWTGRMEDLWRERMQNIERNETKPLSSTEWAKFTFGTVGKHIFRALSDGSTQVINNIIGGKYSICKLYTLTESF